MQALKIGLIGIGRHGSIHLEYLQQSSNFELIGCFDHNSEKLQRIEEDYGVKIFENLDELIDAVDVIDIVTPANTHYYYAEKALKKSKHVFIESPITEDIIEAQQIIELSREANVKVQIGHIERFNPVFISVKKLEPVPQIIETHRIGLFDLKKAHHSVLFELMIQDIDLILNLVKANIKYIHANGVAILSQYIDTITARIEFDNGCVAVLNASKSITNKKREMKLFEEGRYFHLDFIKRNAEYVSIEDEMTHGAIPTQIDEERKYITTELIANTEYDSLKMQMDSFADAIINNTHPEVSVEHGYKALEVAHIISEKIRKRELGQI
ncbi:MAG TPA: Gfo/Idh/MocA family oxidoreductase [Chitinophagales bacterium]|nr:Gfo/Idh/MocA family oxidoreductase [Chitinophagales bacterium]